MATGDARIDSQARRARRQGMTLMEILIVLAIVGVASGAVVLGLGGMDRDTAVQIEANRFADRLRLASDDVLVAGRPLSLVWGPRGYAFQGGENLTDALADRHDLAAGVRMTGPEGDPTALIDPDSAAPALDFAFRKGARVWTVRFDGLNAEVAAVSPAGAAG